MKNKKMFVSLLGVGLAIGTPWQALAQEPATQNPQTEASAPAEAMPPQSVSDGGVEAVREAQDSASPTIQERVEAEDVLRKIMESKGWTDGWDDTKKRFIAVGTATFKSSNPAKQNDLQTRRRFAAKEAALIAKAKIITFLRQEMEAGDQIITPGTDLNKAMNAEIESLMENVARQKEVIAELLGEKDSAEADKLRGTTFGDRLNDMMAAAIKKMDKEYDANARDKAAAARYKDAVEKFKAEKAHYDALVNKAKGLRGNLVETQKSSIKSMAAMPVFGSTVMLQTESWDKDGTYQISVMMVWSNVLERTARAIVTGEAFKTKPSAKGKSVHEWLSTQDLASMVGPRQYIDKDGNRWFLGVAAESAGRQLHPRVRNINQQRARLFASQEALYCVTADVKAQEVAEDMMQVRESGKDADGNQDFSETSASTYARNLEQKAKMTIRGGQQLLSKTIKHPISGDDIYVVVYGFNPMSVGPALQAWNRNYATKVQAEHHQTVERGRQAANVDAVNAAKNRPQDFQKGYNQQSNALEKELRSRKPASPAGVRIMDKGGATKPVTPAKATSGTFGGDANVSDDF